MSITDPDFRRLISDLTLKDLDSFFALIYARGHTGLAAPLTKIVSREKWGGVAPKTIKKQDLPVENFVISWTNTDPCMTDEECSKAIRNIQKEHMEQGEDDIKYNFLIGANGVLYEGRGWEGSASYDKEVRGIDHYFNNSIKVALINHPANKPPHVMLKAISTLYAIGQGKKYLKKTARFSRITNKEMLSFTF